MHMLRFIDSCAVGVNERGEVYRFIDLINKIRDISYLMLTIILCNMNAHIFVLIINRSYLPPEEECC